jgi:biotin--protein ligase
MVKLAVYRGEGASALSLIQLVKTLRRLAPEMEVVRVGKDELMKDQWKDVDLLIFPGGRDLLYHQSLCGAPVESLRNWVFQGGRYWGICAGGYFGSSAVNLGIGSGNRIKSLRQMSLYPGTAWGPSLGNVEYEYVSQKECEVTAVGLSKELGEGELSAYYNTGCSFVLDHESLIKTRELGWYKDKRAAEKSCCIVESFPEKGYALLCGIHPEFYSLNMPTGGDIHMKRVIKELEKEQKQIDDLFKRLLLRALTASS